MKTTMQKKTFIITIRNTENHSWQGSITWADTGIEKNFRSSLEMIQLIDTAVSCKDAKNMKRAQRRRVVSRKSDNKIRNSTNYNNTF